MITRIRAPIPGVVVVALLVSTTVHAGFINGVETFDGTVKDLATWEEFSSPGHTIVQHELLTYTSPPNGSTAGDFTTRALTVGLGTTVSADVRMNSNFPGPIGVSPELFLTNNSGGTSNYTGFDSYYQKLDLANTTNGFGAAVGSNGQASGQTFAGDYRPQLDTWYTLQITRASPTSTAFAAYLTATGQLLGSTSLSTSGPPQLYVSIGGLGGGSYDWDNVRITPEPATCSALLFVPFAALTRRRRRAVAPLFDQFCPASGFDGNGVGNVRRPRLIDLVFNTQSCGLRANG
jgi:hypothetical protein